jgi:hypothetical protein
VHGFNHWKALPIDSTNWSRIKKMKNSIHIIYADIRAACNCTFSFGDRNVQGVKMLISRDTKWFLLKSHFYFIAHVDEHTKIVNLYNVKSFENTRKKQDLTPYKILTNIFIKHYLLALALIVVWIPRQEYSKIYHSNACIDTVQILIFTSIQL